MTFDIPSGAYFSGCDCGVRNVREKEICDCGKKKPYRDLLWRQVSPAADASGALAVCGLNPSTANATDNDNTIRKLMKLANRLGKRWLIMVNLFSYRLTDSRLLKDVALPIGEENGRYLIAAALDHGLLCAWGKNGSIMARGARVKRELLQLRADLYYLRLLKNGQPEHPLYIPDAIDPRPWESVSSSPPIPHREGGE